jgi:transcriptional regulator with XRE-family HTH domain
VKTVKTTPFPPPSLVTAQEFGQAVRAARTATGMPLTQAAMVVGVASQTLQDIETGTGTVALRTALKVAHELGVSFFVTPSGQKSIVARAIQSTLSTSPSDLSINDSRD